MNEANGISNNSLGLNQEQLTALSEVENILADGKLLDTALGSSLSSDLELVDGLANNIERLDLREIESNSELELFGDAVSAADGLTAEDESIEGIDSFTGEVRVLDDSGSGSTPDNLNESVFTSGEHTQVTLSVLQRQAAYRNEVGLYRVDDATGRIGSLSPGDDGYAAAALAGERRIATLDHGNTKITAEIGSEVFVGSYLVQNNNSQRLLQRNPANRLNKRPLVFFSFTNANPDGFDHLQSTVADNGSLEMAWEDLTGGGDRDFSDSVLKMQFGTPPEVAAPANYAIKAEGKVKFRGRGDLDGETLIAEDDALVYAGRGFEIKGQPILPVQRDAAGNALLNDDNQQLLVPGAVNVGESAAESKIPPSLISRYSGLEQPQIVETQTVEVPDYEAVVESQYDLAVGEESEVATVPANTRLNNLHRWSDNFPAPGTPENPTVVMVQRNGLTIPSGVDLANYVIIVERGNVKFNGGEHNLNNVTIIAEQGKIELNRVNSNDSSFLAAKSIKVKNRSVFGGESLIANAQGKIEINSYSLRQPAASNLKVVAASDLQIKSTSEFNGELITGGDFIAQGSMSIYGSVVAKGDVLLVGRVKVFAVAEDTPEVEPPVATVEEVTVTEASGIARVTISLDTASGEAVSVDYALKDDTAVAGEDYQAASGTIVFNPGETSKTIEIELIDDGIYEADETLLVELDNPNGVILDHDSAAVSITNDDPLPQLAINSVVVTEDSGTVANFEATLSEPSGVTVTVDFMAEDGTATEGDDFTTVSGTLTFAPGETSKTIAAIPIIEDSLDEIDE
ncbi:MAG: Calx-beta domain-containing protein, partial [Cyanobacteria bacterium P01_C01_bin.72]